MSRPEEIRSMIMASEPTWLEGVDPEGQAVYRRQIRWNIEQVIRFAAPVATGLVGEGVLSAHISRWLDAAGPGTRYYWELPFDFANLATKRIDLSIAILQVHRRGSCSILSC